MTPQECIHHIDAQELCNQCNLPTSVSDGTMDLRLVLAGILQLDLAEIDLESDCAMNVRGGNQYILYNPDDADERRAHEDHEKPDRVYRIALKKI